MKGLVSTCLDRALAEEEPMRDNPAMAQFHLAHAAKAKFCTEPGRVKRARLALR